MWDSAADEEKRHLVRSGNPDVDISWRGGLLDGAGFGTWLYPSRTLAYDDKNNAFYFYVSNAFVDPSRNNGRRNAGHTLRCLAIE